MQGFLDGILQIAGIVMVPLAGGYIVLLGNRAKAYLDARLEEADRKKLDEGVANATHLAQAQLELLGGNLDTAAGRAAVLGRVSDYLGAHLPGVINRLSGGVGLDQSVVSARIAKVQASKPVLVATINTPAPLPAVSSVSGAPA